MTDLQINNAFFAVLFASAAFVGASAFSELALSNMFSVGTVGHQVLASVVVYL